MLRYLLVLYLLTDQKFSFGQRCLNNRYNVNQQTDTSTCLVWGNYNVKTFDDHSVSFKSDCIFTLTTFKIGASDFRIDIGGHNNVCRRTKTGCITAVKILYNDVNYHLALDDNEAPIFGTEMKTYRVPTELDGISISQPANRVVCKFTKIGVELKWDKKNMVQVTIDNARGYEVLGLCGNKDQCSSNDQMLVNKIPVDNLQQFLQEWQVDAQACPVPIETQSPCKGVKNRERMAQAACDALRTQRFREANKMLNPDPYIDACVWNYCGCRSGNTMDCLCDTFDAYVKASINAGVERVSWRDAQTCPKQCTGQLVYYPCAPKGGTQTCGDIEIPQAKGQCEEGCYCPALTYLFNKKCYLRKNCPCSHGGRTLLPGATVQQDCHTCTCTDGRVVCPTFPPCKVTSKFFGDPHYVTWDGKKFNFMGKCMYYLIKGNDFSIEADHYVYRAGQWVKEDSNAPSYTRRMIIRMAGQVVELKPKLEVIVNDVPVKRFPHKAGPIVITKPSSSQVLAELPNLIDVQWDGYSTGILRLPTTMEGQVMGLLGTYTGDQSDDFLTPDGDIVSDPVTFGNSWKTEYSCQDEPQTQYQHPCDANPASKGPAEKICGSIKSEIFKQCQVADVDTYYENCVYDTCYCKDNPQQCSCDLLAAFAEECGRKNITVNWRDKIPECRMPCPASQVFQECGDGCGRTCEDLSMRPSCASVCVEGCNCAPGTTMDENGRCIPVAQCKCRIDGIVYPPGYQLLVNEHELLTCADAKWKTSVPNKEQQKQLVTPDKLNGKCDVDNFSIYTPCRYPTAKTCRNMHNYEITTIDVCEEGCECMDGFVFDESAKICVRPEECPCLDGGKSHQEGDAIAQEGCNRCICDGGDWTCKAEDCDKLCIENDVKKEDCNTCYCKDALWECTKHDCSQQCPNEREVKNVDCNTCVCTDGFWTCTNKECHRECNNNDVKYEGCKTCTCQNGSWKCNEDKCQQERCQNENEVKIQEYGKCICKGGSWKCIAGQCDIWGDSHVKTFDGVRYDFQGKCSYVLVDSHSDRIEFKVHFENELCGHAGATCLKSVRVDVSAPGIKENITLTKNERLPSTKHLKNLVLIDYYLFATVKIPNAGVQVFWDKKTWVYVKLEKIWQEKVMGLCGNYNRVKEDDLQVYEQRMHAQDAMLFVDLWRTDGECDMAKPNSNTCDESRGAWAQQQCNILLSDVFAPCRSKITVDDYYKACVMDSCKCDLGGDCECLCTALATYAQHCNNYGINVDWRTQNLCPVQCIGNTHYQPCMSTCPPRTCESILANTTRHCEEEEEICIESCGPNPPPPGQVYTDPGYDKTVAEKACTKPKCHIGGIEYYDQDIIIKTECRMCYCSEGKESCINLPCSDSMVTEEYSGISTTEKPKGPGMTTTPSNPGRPDNKGTTTESEPIEPVINPASTTTNNPIGPMVTRGTTTTGNPNEPDGKQGTTTFNPRAYPDSNTTDKPIGPTEPSYRGSTSEPYIQQGSSPVPATQPEIPTTTEATIPPIPGVIWPTTTTERPTQETCIGIKCPKLSCPASFTKEVKIAGQCCSSCQHETKCVVNMQYSKKLMLKQHGQTWTDGPCRECTCLGEDSYHHCTQCKTKVCAQAFNRNATIGSTYYEFVSGPCCPALEPVACIHNNKLYRIGELWDVDQCTSIKCIKDPANNITFKQEMKEYCNENCPVGYIYKKSQNTCCGQCVQQGCIFGNTAKQPGEKWRSEDGCTLYACEPDKGQYRVYSRRNICPPVLNCPGAIKKSRCCKYCSTSELFVWKDEELKCNYEVNAA